MSYSHILNELEISALRSGVSFGFIRLEKLNFFSTDLDLPWQWKTFFQHTLSIKFLAIINMKI